MNGIHLIVCWRIQTNDTEKPTKPRLNKWLQSIQPYLKELIMYELKYTANLKVCEMNYEIQ